MPRRVLRGYRLGTPTGQPDRDACAAPRAEIRFVCRRGHDFIVPFSTDAEIPAVWTCPRHGIEHCLRTDDDSEWVPPQGKPPRTHYVMLLERRSIADLENLVAQALAGIDQQRRSPQARVVIGDRTYSFRFGP
ncbi:RNA polymerase-binding protein RbpA [Umezawaea sp. Da 62-37]|uniref:RNA polymerase-binding protein RbpA n=1 Tax=Umezawaea sp. Da 62-37 TaxID=3075927 RepID=UPI0028F6D041|nr:RNA polymerase-binding protein RbpA [Umezawaea sp. Da 62-37]WNV90258.1 RNA polymerase-binding protein RbpA [Umezawaea sp. Da 62-37]